MRMKLRWKIAGSYAALMIALAVAVGAYVQRAVERQLVETLRDHLATSCALARDLLDARAGDDLDAVTNDIAVRTAARVTVIAPGGEVLADSIAEPSAMPAHDTRPEVVDARLSGLGWAIRRSVTLDREMLYVAQGAGERAPIVRLAVPLTQVRLAIADIQRSIMLAAVVAAFLAMLAGAWLAGGVTRSLDELTSAAIRIGEGDLSTRARVAGSDETRELAAALNNMAESLEETRAGLERSAAHLRSILTQMADGVIVVAPDETIQVFNPAAGALLGADPATAVGKRLAEVALHYELAELPRRAMRLRTPAQGEARTSREPSRIIAAVAAPIATDSGQTAGAVMTLRDVTEVQRLQQVRQDFVTNAGHELRTPVAAIRSLAETLAQGALTDPEAAPRFLAQIVQSTENLARLLDDMLVLARLEGAEHEPERGTVDVRAALVEAAARIAPQAQSKSIEVTVAAPEGLQAWCSEDNLMAALVNLLDNAVKYTPDGGRVEAAAEARDDHVRIAVTDDGPGVPEAHRERIFERFYRVDKGRSRQLGGTGLGLSIVRHAVESDGGRVWVEGPEGGGARFVITLPTRASPGQ